MAMLTGLIRRLVWLVVLALVGGAIAQWWRERQAPDAPAAPEWPPIDVPDTVPDSVVAAVADVADVADTADVEEAAAETATAWVAPGDDGACPISHPIKANDNSGIFHVPGGRFYDRTKAERCYVDADAATADGYRRAKS